MVFEPDEELHGFGDFLLRAVHGTAVGLPSPREASDASKVVPARKGINRPPNDGVSTPSSFRVSHRSKRAGSDRGPGVACTRRVLHGLRTSNYQNRRPLAVWKGYQTPWGTTIHGTRTPTKRCEIVLRLTPHVSRVQPSRIRPQNGGPQGPCPVRKAYRKTLQVFLVCRQGQ